jgi:hypothetical protein
LRSEIEAVNIWPVMLCWQSSLLGVQFRDISDYKRAFTDARKDTNSRPESR